MGRNRKPPAGRRSWLVGGTAVLLAMVIVGVLAIVHYSSLGDALAASAGRSTAAGQRHVTSAVTSARRTASRARLGARLRGSGRNRPATSALGAPARGASRASASSAQTPSAPLHFRTLPPGAKLPSGGQCATWVLATPLAENKGVNKPFNHTFGHHVARSFLQYDAPQADQLIVPRIDGHFKGTTEQILRWAACKWGINQNVVFAQAAIESWWRQTTRGDYGTDVSACPPGYRTLNAQGQCAQSYGILQNRYPFEKPVFPGVARSTAMNADTAYAIWRTCFEGYETWLNSVHPPTMYHKGDLWGCVGRWFSGRWRTAPALQYIGRVKDYMRQKIWTTPNFQEP